MPQDLHIFLVWPVGVRLVEPPQKLLALRLVDIFRYDLRKEPAARGPIFSAKASAFRSSASPMEIAVFTYAMSSYLLLYQ